MCIVILSPPLPGPVASHCHVLFSPSLTDSLSRDSRLNREGNEGKDVCRGIFSLELFRAFETIIRIYGMDGIHVLWGPIIFGILHAPDREKLTTVYTQ